MGRVIPVTPDEVERMDRLYRAGATLLQVAEQVGRTQQTVRVALRRHGTPMRTAGRRTAEEIAAAARMLAEANDLAFEGDWVRQGLIWKPRPKQTEDTYRAHRRAYQRQWAREKRSA